jgi:hypothetical protein
VTRVELAKHGVIDPMTSEEHDAIRRGEVLFSKGGCDQCHLPSLKIDDPTFSTPSLSPLYRDAVFPGGLDPRAEGVDPLRAVSYDLTHDLPDNLILTASGEEVRLGVFATHPQGGAVIPLYADLKRHDMGPELADGVDETGTGPSVWLNRPLWGVGSTDPYLHDGRATTPDEAILAHGGEAAGAGAAYGVLGEAERAQIIAFLENMVLFRTLEDEEEEEEEREGLD